MWLQPLPDIERGSDAQEHNAGYEDASIALKIFVSQLLNTGLLVLLLRSQLVEAATELLPGQHYKQISARWYAEIGSPLILTMLIQFFTCPTANLVLRIVPVLLRCLFGTKGPCCCCSKLKATTQNALNDLYKPPDFDMHVSHAETMLGVVVTLLYGVGLWIGLAPTYGAGQFWSRYRYFLWISITIRRSPSQFDFGARSLILIPLFSIPAAGMASGSPSCTGSHSLGWPTSTSSISTS
jgi:hypothetical protein